MQLFACLQIEEYAPRGIIERVLGRLTRPKTDVAEKTAFGAGYFLVTTQVKNGRGVDWEGVTALLPGDVRTLLTPAGYPLPDGLGFLRPVFPRFEADVLLRTACALIESTRMPIYRRVIGLLDKTGDAAWMLPELLKYYSSVRVVTENLPRYEAAAEDMLERLGAPVQFGNEPSDFSGCVLLLCPEDRDEPLPALPRCPVLAGGRFAESRGCNILSGLRVLEEGEAPPGFPPGIPPHAFAGALRELRGVSLGDLRARRLSVNGRRAGMEEAARLLLREAGYPGTPGL